MDSEFSSNRFSTPVEGFQAPIRHPDLCFDDGNLAVVTGSHYFVVHRGLLCRHSEVLEKQLVAVSKEDHGLLEGHTVLALDDDPTDFAHFLRALYGFSYDNSVGNFPVASAILRLSTKYEIAGLRETAIRNLSVSWPTTLDLWELREKAATSADGMYAPRPSLPHPILLINLAREIEEPTLLPSAFYDLSRYLPSQLMEGHAGPDGVHHHLTDDDLCKVLRGKEQGARFFSTFIVTELEARGPSVQCLHRNEVQPALKRACQMAFEAVTFELIRDVNGMVCNRNTDPLFTIADSVLMQTRDDQPGVENKAAYRACEACRLDYAAVVQAAREDFWRQLPTWFELDVKNWG
ncbi:uncharacterized protein TRAVEDRAFT_113630 [Trametes versicolor FP-101664 SS1]|uniref:uncharacterized protein n=1 Tax=Trametes versicolor (strain FP-101664) TaxID=717944 RepID=UPI0004622DF4|nr:uncharacterized protein TRAVEDRAFT_113630 [Trametes versicolor FP-101664 SS1]EIW63073.1 hypothetical protein TRAVEDRAFT_113630 [Trametes versicolor FP-101664 SS1]